MRNSTITTALLWQVAPARVGELDGLLNRAVEIDSRERELRLALTIELAHAGDGARHVLDGPLDRGEIAARPLAQILLTLQQRLGIERDWRDRVVDVVRDAAGHLAQSAQALLLQHCGLRAAQDRRRPVEERRSVAPAGRPARHAR